MRPILSISAALMLASVATVTIAQDNQPNRARGDGQSAEHPESDSLPRADPDLDTLERVYRKLVCGRAADFSHPLSATAIDLAVRFKYVDSRFDAPIREVMGEAVKPDSWDVSRLNKAVQLLPLSTLDSREGSELTFGIYLQCEDSSAERRLATKCVEQLALSRAETGRLVLKRMSEPRFPVKLLRLVNIVDDASRESLLLLMLDAAKSDDTELAKACMQELPQVIEWVRRSRQRIRSMTAEERALLADGFDARRDIDAKLIQYSKRIIDRYDSNKDQRLSPAEYKTMLLSPAPADTDSSGDVTVIEYARWMRSRTGNRNQP